MLLLSCAPDQRPSAEISPEPLDLDAVVYFGAVGSGPGAWSGPEQLTDQRSRAEPMVTARDAAGKPSVMESYFAGGGAEGVAYLRRDGVPVVRFLADAAS
jgi:hypothetical protein